MASVRKLPTGKWVCEVRRVRPKFYQSKIFGSKPEAQSWGIEQERRLDLHKSTPSRKTLLEAMERYKDDVAPKHKGARWEIIRLVAIANYSIVHFQLDDLTPEDFQSWINERMTEVSPATVRREFQLFRSVMKHARVKLKWTVNHPLVDIELPKAPKHRERRISDAEIGLVCKALGYVSNQKVATQRHAIGAAFLFAIETAMRQGEIWLLEINPEKLKQSYCTAYDTKNGDDRDIPLSPDAIKLIKSFPDYLKGRLIKNVTQATAGVIFRRACELAGIENLRFHDTRHEACTRLAKKLSPLDLAKVLGHRDSRSMMIYYNPTAAELSKLLR